MHSALLSDGKVVTALAYDDSIHGVRINCMDKACRVPVHFMQGTVNSVAHFKTSGKGDSIHKEGCGFAKPLTFQETVHKVAEYQETIKEQGIREYIIKLNLNSLDPDYEAKVSEEPKAKKDEDEEKEELDSEVLKDENPTPKSISSLKTVKKLFTTVEPDLLASIIISVKGNLIPISELIRHHELAHSALWDGTTLDVPYFIHGRIEQVIRRDKVWYVNLSAQEDKYFSLVIFERYFNHFTLKDHELIGKEILAVGTLKKNEFNEEKKSTEMMIKSNKYIEFL